MKSTICWGILGTGSIAHKFAEGLKAVPDATLLAVGSRTIESANRFADAFDAPHRYPSYEALAHDSDVDAIYVATPHVFHAENTILCLEAGKAVLCEKPFAINAAQALSMINTARSKGIFLMEAMWTRFLPVLVKFRELLDEGAIGEPRMLFADFGFTAPVNPKARLFNLTLGGGALLDVGVYPISLSSMVFGTPVHITSSAHLGSTGVDEQSAYLLTGPSGQLSLLSSAIRTQTTHAATLMGTNGMITIRPPWWRPVALTLSRPGKSDETFNLPFEATGYNCEAAHVGDCLRAGKLESSIMPLDESLSIMRTLDAIRASWGLKYPGE